jgi:hypothetical protein
MKVMSPELAIGAGVAETLVRLTLADPPTPSELVVRFSIYAALAVLVLALRSGRNAVRWTLTVVLGGVGTVSLIVEPLSWLLTGAAPAAILVTDFLVNADGPTLLIVGLRVAHIAAVIGALLLMFRPQANAFFAPIRVPSP